MNGKTVFVAPPADGRATGGFLLNEQIAGLDLRREPNLASALNEADAALLVDSIYLFDHTSAGVLGEHRSTARAVLLAHSLPSLLLDDTPAVRREHLHRERTILRRLAGAIAPSEFMARALERRGLDRSRIAVVSPAPVVDGRTGSRERRPRSTRPPSVLTVANWSATKGIVDAVRAMTAVADLKWRWTLVGSPGSGAYREAIEAALAAAGLGARVEIAGAVPSDALRPRFGEADIFLLPSYMESYGLVYAEAISHGVPVVAYAAAAVPEVVEAGGALAPAGNEELLAQTLRSMMAPGSPSAARARAAVIERSRRLPDRHGFLRSFGDALEDLSAIGIAGRVAGTAP